MTTSAPTPGPGKPDDPKPESTPTAKCVVASDGFHSHTYRLWHLRDGKPRSATIEHHLHQWMDEHRQAFPDMKDVEARDSLVNTLGHWDTVEKAWAALGVRSDMPTVECKLQAPGAAPGSS